MNQREKALAEVINDYTNSIAGGSYTLQEVLSRIDSAPPQDFSKCKVGDKLYSLVGGECEVTKVTSDYIYTRFSNDGCSHFLVYKTNGHDGNNGSDGQLLFFFRPIIIAPQPEKRMVKKTVYTYIKNHKGVFASFDGGLTDNTQYIIATTEIEVEDEN